MAAKLTPRKLKGFRDYLPAFEGRRQQFTETIYRLAQVAGYEPVGTPCLEYAETLLGTGSDETDKEVYRFKDHGERDVALRFDLTVPFARFAAENLKDLVLPFKRVQCAEVWRGEKPQKGRYREFRQCDIDIVGADTMVADIDVLLTLFRILAAFELPSPFTMQIGNRPLLSGLIRRQCAPKADDTSFRAVEGRALVAIDKLAKIGVQKVGDALREIFPEAPGGAIEELLQALTSKDEAGGTDLQRLQTVFSGSPLAGDWERYVETIAQLRRRVAASTAGRVVPDLGIARGLGYYTGVVFETTLDHLPGFGSISSGGRYDNLAERFTTQELQGVGGSIGLDRLVAALEEIADDADGPVRRGVFVAVASPASVAYGLEIVDRLRQAGVPCDLSAKQGKLANQFRLADRRAARYVITVGPEEEGARLANLKDLASGEEKKNEPIEGLVASLTSELSGR